MPPSPSSQRPAGPPPGPSEADSRPAHGPLALALKKAPSQKELAGIFHITTRQLRRWERAEETAHHFCSRPYNAADLWRLYQRRRPKEWDRTEAARLGLSAVFEHFDEVCGSPPADAPADECSTLAALLLKSLAWEGAGVPAALPRLLGQNLTLSAKHQLRAILRCERASSLLVAAFFEAALMAEAPADFSATPAAAMSA